MSKFEVRLSSRLRLLLVVAAVGLSAMAAPGFALPSCPVGPMDNCTDYRDACEAAAYGTCHLAYAYQGQCVDVYGGVHSAYHATCGSCFMTTDCSI
jgi:hypothetical protein